MPDTVSQHGLDTSGRAILSTDYMWDVWQAVCADLPFDPVIVQGAFMSRIPGGGAKDSAGYHDEGGCFDVRTWDLSTLQIDILVRVLREHGCAAWRRDAQHGGFDAHLHFVLGTDKPLAGGAASQWQDYIKGGDGLVGSGRDYEKRPDPLVLKPPEVDMASPKDWDAADWKAFDAHIFDREIGGEDKLRFEQIVNQLKTWLKKQ